MRIIDTVRTIEEARGLVAIGAYALVNHRDENGVNTKLVGPDASGGVCFLRLCPDGFIKMMIEDGLLVASSPLDKECFAKNFCACFVPSRKDE